MSKFFYLPNLATDEVSVLENPWDVKVDPAVLDLPKEAYKKRWFNPATKHYLLLLTEGQNPSFCVSSGNQAAAIHGFFADYDGVFTEDIVDALKTKAPGKYKPAYWCLSQSKRLHLVWLFDRPVTVTGNAHANELLHVVATKLKAVRWGVGYDIESEICTQVMDIGREWHVFKEHSFVPAEEVIMWDNALWARSAKKYCDEVVDIPLDVVAAEIKKRDWPHEPPQNIAVGTRCVRFWAADADNVSGAQFTKDGIRVYTPHDGGFKSWVSLLGRDFCEAYTAKSMAPFYENTFYDHRKDEYWRFFRNDRPVHFEKRTEKVLRRDLLQEARLDPKPAKGEALSELDRALYTISRRNAVDGAAPILYRKTGRIQVRGVGTILNTSLVTVKAPVERLSAVTPEELEKHPDCPPEYKIDPSICAWDNPFAVCGFPHIHRLLTAFFMRSTAAYRKWVENDCPLRKTYFSDPQLDYLLSWLSHFYVNAARMPLEPGRGQALILAGPAGTGKSFFARQLLGQLMGGAVDAEKFYLEGSRFNSGIVGSPVHLIDDKLGAKSQRTRLQFTESLKIVVANAVLRYEAKFGSAIETVPWPGRVVILSNEDAQSMSVMPDLDMSTRDKFMMLKLGGAMFDWGTDAENQKWLAEELPYFARFLLGWRIPAELRDERFGVKATQHADMAQASAENGLTQVLVEVLETCIESVAGSRDGEDAGDSDGWAVEGNAVKVFKWIASVDPGLAREVIDSRTLQQCLQTLYKNGAYNIALDEATKRWRIPYVLRKKVVASVDNHTEGVI